MMVIIIVDTASIMRRNVSLIVYETRRMCVDELSRVETEVEPHHDDVISFRNDTLTTGRPLPPVPVLRPRIPCRQQPV